jgi:hypothetical protein
MLHALLAFERVERRGQMKGPPRLRCWEDFSSLDVTYRFVSLACRGQFACRILPLQAASAFYPDKCQLQQIALLVCTASALHQATRGLPKGPGLHQR